MISGAYKATYHIWGPHIVAFMGFVYGAFHNEDTPIAGWFISWKILLMRMICGYPHFAKPPYSNITGGTVINYIGIYIATCCYPLVILKKQQTPCVLYSGSPSRSAAK